ncbi:MAG: hypothetical protein ACRDJ9_33295 [Dehalococcoidia bacterium]
MTAALVFIALALAAAWLPDHATVRKPITALAGGVGIYGMSVHGWVGWRWDWGTWWVLAAFTLFMLLALGYRYRRLFSPRVPALDDLAWGVAWGALQQGVLLGFLLQVHPLLAIVAFPVLHAPNGLLVTVTAVAGPVSVLIAEFVGLSIPAAAVCHAVLSLGISLGLPRSVTHGMCVGWDCAVRKVRIL